MILQHGYKGSLESQEYSHCHYPHLLNIIMTTLPLEGTYTITCHGFNADLKPEYDTSSWSRFVIAANDGSTMFKVSYEYETAIDYAID